MPQELQNLKKRITKNVDLAGGRYATYKYSFRRHLTDPKEWQEVLDKYSKMSHQEFYALPDKEIEFQITQTERCELITYPSPFPSGIPENDLVQVELFRKDKTRHRPTILFAHGRARYLYYRQLLGKLYRSGFDVAFFTLPYHITRTPEGFFNGELFITGNLPRSFHACRQATLDIQAFINYLDKQGAPIHLMGMSLGGLFISNILTVDSRASSATFLAPVIDPEYMLCNSILSRDIRRDIRDSGIDFDAGRFLFTFITPYYHRPLVDQSRMYFAIAESDQYISDQEVDKLWQAWNKPLKMTYPHSHFTLIFSQHVQEDLLNVIKCN